MDKIIDGVKHEQKILFFMHKVGCDGNSRQVGQDIFCPKCHHWISFKQDTEFKSPPPKELVPLDYDLVFECMKEVKSRDGDTTRYQGVKNYAKAVVERFGKPQQEGIVPLRKDGIRAIIYMELDHEDTFKDLGIVENQSAKNCFNAISELCADEIMSQFAVREWPSVEEIQEVIFKTWSQSSMDNVRNTAEAIHSLGKRGKV